MANTKSEDVIAVLQRIDEESRYAVKEVILDLSDSMRKIVRTAFPKASRVIDRFHIQKLACDAVQELRINMILLKFSTQVEKVGYRTWQNVQSKNLLLSVLVPPLYLRGI